MKHGTVAATFRTNNLHGCFAQWNGLRSCSSTTGIPLTRTQYTYTHLCFPYKYWPIPIPMPDVLPTPSPCTVLSHLACCQHTSTLGGDGMSQRLDGPQCPRCPPLQSCAGPPPILSCACPPPLSSACCCSHCRCMCTAASVASSSVAAVHIMRRTYSSRRRNTVRRASVPPPLCPPPACLHAQSDVVGLATCPCQVMWGCPCRMLLVWCSSAVSRQAMLHWVAELWLAMAWPSCRVAPQLIPSSLPPSPTATITKSSRCTLTWDALPPHCAFRADLVPRRSTRRGQRVVSCAVPPVCVVSPARLHVQGTAAAGQADVCSFPFLTFISSFI